MEELKIQENGESVVQVTTIGKVVGTGPDGEPVEQTFDEESLKAIVETQKDDQILVDQDHESENGGSTAARGWLTNLFYKAGEGIFGTIRWTNIGRELIENKVFRWLSPAFNLNENMKPIQMTSVALTNTPAQAGRIRAILNSKCNNEDVVIKEEDKLEKMTMEITKEELKKFIVDTITELKANEEVVEKTEEVKEETKEEVKEEVKEEAPAADPVEEVKEEVKAEEPKDVDKQIIKEEKKEEVIKIEALNSAPKMASMDPEWKSMTPAQFRAWCDAGNWRKFRD